MRALGLWLALALLGVACGRLDESASAPSYPVASVPTKAIPRAPEGGVAAPAEAVRAEPVNPDAERVVRLQHELAPYVVGLEQDDERADFTIPPPARPRLSQLEDALLSYVEHELVELTRKRCSGDG